MERARVEGKCVLLRLCSTLSSGGFHRKHHLLTRQLSTQSLTAALLSSMEVYAVHRNPIKKGIKYHI